MSKHLRLTEDQLCAIQKRVVERGAVVRTKASPGALIRARRRSKYSNEPTEAQGMVFASKKEADRYQQLKLLEVAGEISDLRCQVPFPIRVNGVLICKYIADFTYTTKSGKVVEDTKGYRNSVYRLKAKLMKAFGVEILET